MGVLSDNAIIGASAAGEAYDIEKSLRFNDNDSAYLQQTQSAVAGNRKTWTLSFWTKRGNLDAGANDATPFSNRGNASTRTSNALRFTDDSIFKFFAEDE